MPRKRKLTDEESIAFGKLCGCNRCRYCYDWQHEQLMQRMEDEVRRGKEIAEDARKEWLDKHINRS
jgi:sulfatase maturation enzyme AslB (radical SAM superfamily)